MSTSRERYGEDFGAEQMWGLAEAPLPDPVGYWPQTPGWLVVGVAVLALLLWWGRRRRAAWRRNAWRRHALTELAAMQSDDGRLARLPHLLRYCALHLAPRRDVASLRGQAWVDWLNARAGQALFTLDDAVRLDALAYGRRGAEPGDARLAARCRAWLRGGHARV